MPSRIINSCKQNNICSLIKSQININQPDIWGRYPIYYSVRYQAVDVFYWFIEQGADIYSLNLIHGERYDLIITALQTRNPIIVDIVLSHWNRPINIDLYWKYMLVTPILLDLMLSYYNNRNIKGSEHIFCMYAKIPHYQILYKRNVCFSLIHAIRYCLTYNKQQEFNYLLTKIKCSEQLDFIFTTSSYSTLNLLTIAATHGKVQALKKLLSYGANPEITILYSEHQYMTPLEITCSGKYIDSLLPKVIKCIKLLSNKTEKKEKIQSLIR